MNDYQGKPVVKQNDSNATQRPWIVSLPTRSAVRLADNKNINIRATPESTLAVAGIRIRNQICINVDQTTFVGALVVEGIGYFDDKSSAVSVLGNLASPYLQIAAVAANAAVDESTDILCSAPPRHGEDNGAFLVQRHSQPRAPAPIVRDLDVPAFFEMINAVHSHAREDRLHRAMAHYRLALGHMDAQNWMLAAEFLYVSVENLSRVVTQRLLREKGLPDTGEGKHLLAVSVGIGPKSDKDRSHLGKFDSWVRETEIFLRDTECYKNILSASDAFEHGLQNFDFIRERTAVSARKAFGYVRLAILRELGIPQTSALFDEKYRLPLGDWKPILQVEGTYTDSDPQAIPDLTSEAGVLSKWPDFVGPTITPMMDKVVDSAEGRTISLKLHGNGQSILETQKITLGAPQWIVPCGKEVGHTSDFKVTEVLLNGNDITAAIFNGEDLSNAHPPAAEPGEMKASYVKRGVWRIRMEVARWLARLAEAVGPQN